MNRELEKTANCLRTTAWGFTRTKQGNILSNGDKKADVALKLQGKMIQRVGKNCEENSFKFQDYG